MFFLFVCDVLNLQKNKWHTMPWWSGAQDICPLSQVGNKILLMWWDRFIKWLNKVDIVWYCKEEKKILHGQFSLSLNLLHLKGLTCTGEGSSKNKINLQLNKNTLSIIQSWKIPHYIFGITLDSYNQLAIRSTEITTHSFTLVWFTAQDWDLWYTQLSEHWKHTDSIVHLQRIYD